MSTWSVWRLAPESDEQERVIVTAEDGEREVCGIVYREEDANLIAAAPELLEAARKVIRDGYDNDAIDALWDAIAKAEGGN